MLLMGLLSAEGTNIVRKLFCLRIHERGITTYPSKYQISFCRCISWEFLSPSKIPAFAGTQDEFGDKQSPLQPDIPTLGKHQECFPSLSSNEQGAAGDFNFQ